MQNTKDRPIFRDHYSKFSASDCLTFIGTEGSGNGRRECFFDGFFVDFDTADRVEFIELGKVPQFRATFNGVALHEIPADEAVAFVSQYDRFDSTNLELGYSYLFLELQLSLWRGTCPEPDQPLDDLDGRFFEAVGIAVAGYFKRSSE